MNKSFLVKHMGKCYCSKCSEEIIVDKNNPKEYVIRTHENKCKTTFVNFNHPRIAEDTLAYDLKIENNTLILQILKGNFVNNKFLFEIIYEAKFTANSRNIKESGEENINYWKEMIKFNFLYEDIYDTSVLNINDQKEIDLINKVFPNIPFINNIADFIDIYLTKGYIVDKKDLDKELAKIPHQKIDLNIGNSHNRTHLYLCFLKEHEVLNEIFFEVTYVEGVCKNGKVEALYKNRCLVSNNYIYNPKKLPLDLLKSEKVIYPIFRYEKFTKKYPEIKLKEYIESGGKKIIPFIFSTNNDLKLELIGKSGLGYLADNYRLLLDIDFNGTNLKSIFKLPIKALKCLNSEAFVEYINHSQSIEKFVKLYEYQRMVYKDVFNKSTIEFISQNLFCNNPRIYNFEMKDIIKYINYTQSKIFAKYNEKNIVLINIYIDYLNMCSRHNLYPGGKFPTDLIHCHDLMCNYQKERIEANRNAAFIEAINHPRYQALKTCAEENDEFVILLPRNADDLVEESYQMHNCVRSYVDAVAKGNTYIVFLRYNKKRSCSYVTIEVTSNYVLRQVKASHNAAPNKKVIDFVIKWATEKNITYSSCLDLKCA